MTLLLLLACAEECTIDVDGDGFVSAVGCAAGDDCDDLDPSVHPGAEEACDGLDEDCDGEADPAGLDADGDSVQPPECGGNDCDDNDPMRSPLLDERCADGKDNNCNGEVDDADLDRDGQEDLACGGEDCDDEDPQVHPDLPDFCDGVDRDCDGAFTADRDGDGDDCSSDCNDGLAAVGPGEKEVCDGLDNDCDGVADTCAAALPGAMDFEGGVGAWPVDDTVWTAGAGTLDGAGTGAGKWRLIAYDDAFLTAPWVFEADLTREAGVAPVGILMSRAGGTEDGYGVTLAVSGNKASFNVGRIDSGAWATDTGDVTSKVVFPGTGLPDHLRLEHDGTRLVVSINGTKVRTITTGSDLSKGYPALIFYDTTGDGLKASWDNVSAE